jgi:predicted  nucleic acid-binding Zn-ribbon protein
MKVILDVCKDMKPAKKELPTSKDLSLINSTLLADGASVLTRLPLDSGLQSKSVQLVSYCLGAGFSLGAKGKSLATPQTQLALIRWVNGQPKLLNPGKEIQGLIAARIRDWNDDFLKLLGSELDALHPSLRDPITGALGKSTGSQSQGGSAGVALSIPDQEVGHSERTADDTARLQTDTIQDAKDTYDALYELGRLTHHIKQMNMALNHRQEDVAKLDRHLQQAKVELEGTCREKEEAKRSCSVIKDELAESLARGKKLEQSVNSLKEQIENLKSKLVGAENHHKETVESHNAHADELSKRIAQEGDQRLATFRNKMAGILRPVATNLKEARSMEMTPELGITMRTQLRQILNIMKSQGIAIEGDDA